MSSKRNTRDSKRRRSSRRSRSTKGGQFESAIMRRSLQKLNNLYNQNGSGKTQYGGADINDLVSKIVSNRVLDLYLKYLGVTMLNSATLVPFALIMGKEYFEKYLGPRLERDQKGGGEPLPRVVPFIDHPYIGTFLKLAGIPLVGLTTNTLVPLGILMIVYEMVKQLSDGSSKGSSKKGGRLSLRRRRSKRSQRGGDGSQYAVGPLYSLLGNTPVTSAYQQCQNFAPQAECCNAALKVQSIQNEIVPVHTRYPEFQQQLSCSPSTTTSQ